MTAATRAAALDFARENPFVFEGSAFFDPERFRDVPNYTLHVLHPGDRPSDVHVFFKEGTDTTALLARIDEDMRSGCSTWGCTGRVFTHPTPFSQHEYRAVPEWVMRSPLRPWFQSAFLDWSIEPLEFESVIRVSPGAIEVMREMLDLGGVPDEAVTVTLSRDDYEPLTGRDEKPHEPT